MLAATDPARWFRLTRTLLAILEDPSNPSRASDAAACVTASLDGELAASPATEHLDCGKGCAHCCWNWIGATAPEIFLLARALRRQDESGDVTTAIQAAAARSAGADRTARLAGQHACAALSDDVCSAHAGRPLVCRATVSTRVAACIAARQGGPDTIPVPSRFVAARGTHDQCLWAALTEVGLTDTSYELNQALATVIDDPTAEQRWLAGEDIFASVEIDGTGDAQTRAFGRMLINGARRLKQ